MADGPLSFVLEAIRTRDSAVWHARGHAGAREAIEAAKDDVPRLLAVVDELRKAADRWQLYSSEGDAADECAADVRRIITRELTGEGETGG